MIYKINLVSQKNAIVLIITLLTFFIGGVLLIIPHGLHDKWLAYLVVLIAAISAYFLWQKFVTCRSEWTIDDKKITIVCNKKFILPENKNISLNWTDIENISRGVDPQYYNLKIKLTSGKTFKFFHAGVPTKDDFGEMLKTLYQTLHNKKTTATKNLASSGGRT